VAPVHDQAFPNCPKSVAQQTTGSAALVVGVRLAAPYNQTESLIFKTGGHRPPLQIRVQSVTERQGAILSYRKIPLHLPSHVAILLLVKCTCSLWREEKNLL
jgi:hypothetical protein